jgi:ribosomal protein S18 acetylase RimI-like enzyme
MMEDADLLRLGDSSYLEALREQARATGGSVREGDGVLLVTGAGSFPLHNYGIRTDPGCDPAVIHERIHQHFAGLGHGYVIVTMNAHDDAPLAAIAAAAGAKVLSTPPAMFCAAEPGPKHVRAGARLAEVHDETGLAAFREVSALAWASYGIPERETESIFSRLEMVCSPHVRAVVGYDGERPASCAMVLLSHGIAGIYWVGTRPDARGKGLAEACTRRATAMGFECGARVVTLQASAMGEPIYRRIGYRVLGSYTLLMQGSGRMSRV